MYGRYEIERRWQFDVHGKRQEHLRASEHPFNVRVTSDPLERVSHGGDQHVEHDDDRQGLEHRVQQRAHCLREIVVECHGLLVAVIYHGLNDHRTRSRRGHAEYAPKQRFQRGINVDERFVLLEFVPGGRVGAGHVFVVLV